MWIPIVWSSRAAVQCVESRNAGGVVSPLPGYLGVTDVIEMIAIDVVVRKAIEHDCHVVIHRPGVAGIEVTG